MACTLFHPDLQCSDSLGRKKTAICHPQTRFEFVIFNCNPEAIQTRLPAVEVNAVGKGFIEEQQVMSDKSEAMALRRFGGDSERSEFRGAYPILSLGLRLRPSLAIMESSVVGFRPRISAAPSFPRTRHPVCSSTFRTCSRSASV